MKSILIASNSSGGGKTTFTLGLMKALKNRNLDVQGYKVGPDYIDPAFHKEVTGKYSRNLDVYLMGEDGVKYSYLKGRGDVGVIEGVMGLYDGIGIGTKASSYDVSRILGNMPVVLVISPKGQSSTICAVIQGLRDYRNANIVGIVLNCVSEKYYNLLKYSIEQNCRIKVLGYIPKNDEISLSSRHLGLVQSMEVLELDKKLELCGNMVEEFVDIDAILSLMQEYKENNEIQLELSKQFSFKNSNGQHIGAKDKEIKQLKEEFLGRKIKIGIAMDKAFSFYYRDNIELLEEIGEVIYFSPMNDKSIPEGLDFLYIGGGYPEVFKEQLEANVSMKESIKKALEGGLKCYAECGGLMYLTKEIDGAKMVGFFDGTSEMTKKLVRFGYCNVNIDNRYYGDEININAHEFHKSDVKLNEETIYKVTKKQYDGKTLKWNCGYIKKNTLAGYAHVNFLGNVEFFKAIL
ncbi:MAG: cobyrinate a,c-diamide synthase [Clostridium butyricum]|nr:cobyrinate a,c-diamide synthase [Clostridium butyricum]